MAPILTQSVIRDIANEIGRQFLAELQAASASREPASDDRATTNPEPESRDPEPIPVQFETVIEVYAAELRRQAAAFDAFRAESRKALEAMANQIDRVRKEFDAFGDRDERERAEYLAWNDTHAKADADLDRRVQALADRVEANARVVHTLDRRVTGIVGRIDREGTETREQFANLVNRTSDAIDHVTDGAHCAVRSANRANERMDALADVITSETREREEAMHRIRKELAESAVMIDINDPRFLDSADISAILEIAIIRATAPESFLALPASVRRSLEILLAGFGEDRIKSMVAAEERDYIAAMADEPTNAPERHEQAATVSEARERMITSIRRVPGRTVPVKAPDGDSVKTNQSN